MTNISNLYSLTNYITASTSGNIGIGTTTPNTKLQINGTDLASFTTNTSYGSLFLQGGAYTGSQVQAIDFGSSSYTKPLGRIGVKVGSNGSSMHFGTSNGYTTGITNTALTIDYTGNIGINNTGATDTKLQIQSDTSNSSSYVLNLKNSSASNLLYVRSDGLLFSPPTYASTTGNAANMYIFAGGDMSRSTSSLKYKKNIVDYNKGINELMQLRPVSYESINPREDGHVFAGLIAEEIQELGFTEYVQYAEDGTPDAISYGNMIALMTKAIQELSAKVTALENK